MIKIIRFRRPNAKYHQNIIGHWQRKTEISQQCRSGFVGRLKRIQKMLPCYYNYNLLYFYVYY